jgi:outer membrane receptor for Fe3+-dicitrate
MIIPQYNALYDPFLNEFFNHPSQKRHLKATGAIQTKKRFSLNIFQEKLSKDVQNQSSRRSNSKNNATSEANEATQKNNIVRFPLLEELPT